MPTSSAILKGIKLAEDLGFLPLLIESDSVNVISLISGKINSELEIDWLISDIKSFIFKKSAFAIRHIPKSGNSAAHKAAKMALDHAELRTWLQDAPPDIVPLL